MNNNFLIKKNFTIIITAIITIGFLIFYLLILLNIKTEMNTILQFLGITVALIVGIITALSSWKNTKNIIDNNEKQKMIVEKYELLLELNIKLKRFKLQSKNNPFLKETIFKKEDYNSYLILIEIQHILENNRNIFLLLFPKTLLNYTQFKFKFNENISSVLPNNQSNEILIKLFKEIFKKTGHENFSTCDLNLIQYPEMADSVFPRLKFIFQSQKDVNIEDYHNGLIIYFHELNELIKIFNKEFEKQKINYEIY